VSWSSVWAYGRATSPSISRILRDQRLVIARRDGQTVYYSLRDPRVTQAFDLLRQVLRSVLREGERLAIAN